MEHRVATLVVGLTASAALLFVGLELSEDFVGASISGALTTALLFGLSAFLYLLPALVADERRHPSWAAILALDVLLGWTVLGWIAALVWALADTGRREE